jgi:sugar phosphate permease
MLPAAARATQWARGLFIGWWVLAACVATQLLTASFTMHAFGVYAAVIQGELGWSTTVFAAALAIQQAGGGVLGPFQGFLIGRFGSRAVIRVGLVIFALALVALSQVASVAGFFAVYVFIAVGSSFAGFLSLNAVVAQWFERHRATAFALMQTGISLGGLLVPFVAWALQAFGWRPTLAASGALVLLLGLPLSRYIGNRPEDMGLTPDGRAPDAPPDARAAAPRGVTRRDFTLAEALRTRAFWLVSFGHALALAVVFAVTTHFVLHLQLDKGFSLPLAASLVTFMTVMSITGQLTGGVLGDRLDKRLMAACAMLGHAAAILVLAYGQTLAAALVFCVVHGLSWGLRGPIMQAIRADYFGRKSFAQILGISNIIVTLGTIAGPLLAGALADHYGTYTPGFTVLAGLALLGALLFVFATPPKPASA